MRNISRGACSTLNRCDQQVDNIRRCKVRANSVQELIRPVPLETFLNEYWERKPLIVRRDNPSYYNTVVTEEDLNNFFGRRDLMYPFIRLVSRGTVLPMEDYVRKPIDQDFPLIDIDRMFGVYRQGGTIIIQRGQLSISSLATFADELEVDIGASVNANLYVTQRDTPGFDPHYDTHDIFILQISGRKSWQLYDSLYQLPLSHQSISKADSDRYVGATPDVEVELTPGDLIYIPRGFVHNTFTTDATSVHITLGVFPFQRIDYLRKIVARAEEDDRFRRFLPTRLSREEDKDFFRANIKTLLCQFINELDVDDLLAGFRANFLAQRTQYSVDRFVTESKHLSLISPDSVLLVPSSITFDLESHKSGALSLRFFDKVLDFPAVAKPALTRLTQAKRVAIKDLGDALDDEGKLVLARTLLEEGFCTVER